MDNVADLEPLKGLSTLELATALLVGYEVEYSSEQHLVNYFEKLKKEFRECSLYENNRMAYLEGQIKGIQLALETLKIEIEGINA